MRTTSKATWRGYKNKAVRFPSFTFDNNKRLDTRKRGNLRRMTKEFLIVNENGKEADCQFCLGGCANWKCTACEAEEEDCLLCDSCKDDHIEAQDGLFPDAKAEAIKWIVPLMENEK